MRELTRSMIRLSWAMPLLGMNQVVRLVSPPDRSRPLDPATETFESLADVAYRQLGPRLRDVYEQGDRLQGRIVDTVFGLLSQGSGRT